MNCQLFNQLLLRPECCSTSNAHYVLLGLKQLDAWVVEVGRELLGDSWEELEHIRQVGVGTQPGDGGG